MASEVRKGYLTPFSTDTVFHLPEFVFGREVLPVPIMEKIQRLGFRLVGGPYEYSRPDQHVRRQIAVWQQQHG